MELGETRFYTCRAADWQVVGPLAYDEVCQLDPEALVAIEGGKEWWPARRWKPDGTLSVTTHEHARAWLYLLLAMPLVVGWLWPEHWRVEFFVCWGIALAVDWVLLMSSKREYPRFPGGS